MDILQNYNLKHSTTFGVEAFARFYCDCKSLEDLKYAIDFSRKQGIDFIILGGGSNVLLTKDFDGLVIKLSLLGLRIISENQNNVMVKAQAGENWHNLVLFAIANNFSGIENLSLIPGSVGAAPMQNIGAYGVEFKEVFQELSALNVATGQIEIFSNAECDFDYRYSVFKGSKRGKYVILSVTLRLSKEANLNTSYGAIKEKLQEMNISTPSIKDVSNAVIAIRQSKLPDPKKIGNAGSFFKNPIVKKSVYEKIKTLHPDCPHYVVDQELVKIPAGFLVEKAGWKGKRFGDAGVHKNQALVLVNHGNASGKEIFELSRKIQESIKDKFCIDLEREVNII